MNSRYIDFTGSGITNENIHLLKESISYDRAASIVANAFLNGLVQSGLTIDQAYNVYLSKAFRHELDYRLEDRLEKVAYKAGAEVGTDYRMLTKTNKDRYGWVNDKHNKSFKKELDKRASYSE
jgi:hypothetical protein